jgi:hypothetical protein
MKAMKPAMKKMASKKMGAMPFMMAVAMKPAMKKPAAKKAAKKKTY